MSAPAAPRLWAPPSWFRWPACCRSPQSGGEREEGGLQQHRHDEQKAPQYCPSGPAALSDQPPESDQHGLLQVRRVFAGGQGQPKPASSSRQKPLTNRIEKTPPA